MPDRRFALVVALLAALVAPGAGAQEPRPAFEIVSVKPRPGSPERIMPYPISAAPRPGGILQLTNTALSQLIMFAYDLSDSQVVGGPEWLRVDRFDVSARAGREVPTATLRLMMQSLLADRFKLAVQEIQRESPVHTLVLARADKTLGPRLKRNEGDCETKETMPPPPPIESRNAIWTAGCGSMSSFASSATVRMNAPVIDKTGLAGNYQWYLYYDGQGRFHGEPADAVIPTRDPNLPQYAEALQEQLGLKLESSRGPVKVVVIDSVQRPTEN